MILKGQLGYTNPEQTNDALGNYTIEVHYSVTALQAEDNSPPPRKRGQQYAVYA